MRFRKNIGSAKPQLDTYNVKDNPEWQLAESMVAEFTDISGIRATYYVKDPSIEPDPLYGETQDVEYLEGKDTKILYETGEIPSVYSMFGLITTDQIVAHIPQCVYHRDVSKTNYPKPGDVVVVQWYMDMGNFELNPELIGRTFEILHVAQDQSIFQLRSLVYVLYLSPYRFSEESDSARDLSSDLTTETPGISSYGDNAWITTESEALSAYDGVDTSVYGYGS
jgi:hypothetical protein